MDDKKPKIDLKDAETILQDAKSHLDKGESIKAIQTAKKADKTVDKISDDFKGAISSVENARRIIDDAKRSGIKTQEAEEWLDKANLALISGKYSEVNKTTKQSYTALQRASFLLGRDLSINAKVESQQGKVKMTVNVENNTDFLIKTLKIMPDLNDTPFLQEGERSFSLKPNKEEKIIYDLTSTNLPGSGDANQPIIGRDVTLEMSLRPLPRENKIIYVVWVTNNTNEVILNLMVTPKLPAFFIPDSAGKLINQILPNEKKQVVFNLELRK